MNHMGISGYRLLGLYNVRKKKKKEEKKQDGFILLCAVNHSAT